MVALTTVKNKPVNNNIKSVGVAFIINGVENNEIL